MGRERIVALLAFILLLPRGHAQTAQKIESPAMVTNADEVTLDLVVRDRKNRPVLDLKPEDITVTDNGAAVKLSDLRLVNAQSAANHSISLLFDPLEAAAATNAREVARKVLNFIPASGFSFSVLTVHGRLQLLQQFTSDRGAIAKAVGAATAVDKPDNKAPDDKAMDIVLPEKQLIAAAHSGTNLSGTTISADERAIAKVMLASLEESQRLVQEQHTQPSLAGLLALANHQRELPGRKLIIYFTAGLQPNASSPDVVRSIITAANRGGITICVIDSTAIDSKVMQGLMQTTAMGAVAASNAQNPPPTGPNAPHGAYGPGMMTEIGNQIDRMEIGGLSDSKNPLAQLTANTGGAYIFSEDNLKKPFRELVADMTTYYEASYVPPALNYDGQFRPVSVKGVRDGLKIQSRPGYFAVPPAEGMRPFEIPLMKLLTASPLPADIKFRAAVLRLGDLPEGNENALLLEIPASELETQDDPNSNFYSLHVSVVALVKNKAGDIIEHFSEDVPRRGSLDSKESAQSEPVTMQRNFVAGPGEYVVEAAILDRNSGKASVERTEFSIPSESNGPSLSDLTMVRRVDQIPAVQMDSAGPFRYGNGKVVPSLSTHVPHGVKQISFFFEVHPDPDSADLPRLEMEVLKDKESLTQVPLQLRKTSGAVVVPYVASIQSTALGAGEYEVIERLTQGGKTSERSLSFTIEAPEVASATAPENAGSASAASDDDAATMPASELRSGSDAVNAHHIVILPAGSVPPPSPDQLQSVIDGARKRALEYGKSLPNFICIESTQRSLDASGNGNWKRRDSFSEMLSYRAGQESRSMLEFNGKRSSLERTDLNSSWPLSVGEFGAMLALVFDPVSKAQFEWKEAGTLDNGGGTLQVLSYRVSHENATITLSQGNDSFGAGFHGLVYIDPATSGIRRITLEADDLPRNFSMRAAAMTVDYDYVAIAGRDYLLPVRSAMSVQRGRKKIELNEMAFHGYRRFASRTKIKAIQ
jgi:VWFA-related protein